MSGNDIVVLLQGYQKEPCAYIATQGPMSHTVADFWSIVWHEKVPIIVMITKLKEQNKVVSLRRFL